MIAQDRKGRITHRFAQLTATATFFLVIAGGLVTSTGSGLAVPDWPLSYGMFFPPMVGGIFYEHGHRMIAGCVVILTIALALRLWTTEPRSWLRNTGLAAVGIIFTQAVLGGMTVLFLLPTPVSVAHAGLAMIFFCLVSSLALLTSERWSEPLELERCRQRQPLLGLAIATTAILYAQILLGAWMRHSGAGLAIPDFPLAFGRVLPVLESPAVRIHFAHRVGALAVTVAIAALLAEVVRSGRETPEVARPTYLLAGLLVAQITLGALTIWSAKAVLPTTAHVAVGALMLMLAVRISLQAGRIERLGARVATGSLAVAKAARA
ncbi:MAG TPA: COX15/CtaA family protein [Candidatus Bathyarchaeia archaeon]|nr:COX15/CtaA family protein [Candidatus Bathyarchaeia archaeon]